MKLEKYGLRLKCLDFFAFFQKFSIKIGPLVAHPASRPYRHAGLGGRSSPECLKSTPTGAVALEAGHIWVLVIVWLLGVTLTIIYILSHPSVKVM